ncbi:hypothetical protein CUMW_095120 [Citrus unshiu]|uniref:NAD-dependent epimerase/dehydratase domain-containing protein n=1 Tax=Citrus unshiu TaxID=55188 RepID=A0A2H5P278_CITUN|nr:hypothetical protein CUMW_095120 [Citrus unshiu]
MAMDQINGKVCVTGASGYLASWLVKRLLLAGYHVTGTVRDPGNERKLAHLWRLEGAKERLQIVRANLMDEGSFDDAINGCQGVFHTASPAEIIEPAVNGTLNVLRSCQKNPSLRRVVLTSSSSTVRIRYDFDSKIPLDESSWSSVDLCESLQIWYALSKILAEKAAWEFCGHNGIDLIHSTSFLDILDLCHLDLFLMDPMFLASTSEKEEISNGTEVGYRSHRLM